MRVFVAIACIVLACLSGRAVQADTEKFDPDKFSQVMTIFDTVVIYPASSWQDERGLKASEYYRNAQPTSFVFEQIPKGEKFESWSKLYAVAGFKLPDLDLETFARASVGTYVQACATDKLKVQTVFAIDKRTMVIIFCEDFKDTLNNLGYKAGIGEITLMLLTQPFKTHLKIYQHWRGDSFDAADKSTWPVSEKTLQMMISRFVKIQTTRAK